MRLYAGTYRNLLKDKDETYSIRHAEAPITKKELAYCVNDDRVVMSYIKHHLKAYLDHVSKTSRGLI